MAEPGLRVAELERLLTAVDPTVCLVPSRLLRRVIKHDGRLPGLGLQVPHRKTYVIARDRLLAVAEPAELGYARAGDLPETLLLLAGTDDTDLAGLPAGEVLLKYWRLLFHTRIHRALDALGDKLSGPALRIRIDRLGAAEFEEARTVLQQEAFLLAPDDDRSVWIEFAAVYLELRHFTPLALAQFFPGIAAPKDVDALLAEDLDVPALLAVTRPEGTPDPLPAAAAPEPEPPRPEGGPPASVPEAQTAADRGNVVRAAILCARAGDWAGAGVYLDRVVQRLQNTLELHRSEAESWRQALPALLPLASRGLWPAAARLLYDLQKVCLDVERAVYKLDLVEWALSLGRRPIKRPLPGQQEVLALQHLSSAHGRLPAVGLADAARHQLTDLFRAALHHSEQRVRERFRPLLAGALENVGLRPHNLPERVARHKLVEELLDRIVARGFINLGDVRDALARNQLKLPDLAHPGEFLAGDALLRLDRTLALEMEGAYRHGEFYLRWLQRGSALAFGTRVGRFLTRYFLLPFGGAFVILEALQHVVEPIAKLVVPPEEAPEEWLGLPVPVEAQTTVHLRNWPTFLLLGYFLFAMLYVPAFRADVLAALRSVGRGIRLLFYDAPAHLLSLPWLQRLLHGKLAESLWRYSLKPLLLAIVGAFLVLPPFFVLWPPVFPTLPPPTPGVWLATVLVLYPGFLGLLYTRIGRNLEERLADQVERTWQHLWDSVLPGLFYLIVDVFNMATDAVNRVIYAGEVLLRFRTGESRTWLYVKPLLGLVWFVIAYVVRFCINLLIEPQINPIKHFPVVTVSHKLVLTLGVPPAAQVLAYTFNLELGEALAIAGLVGSLIPGIFGFLAWELKENWKLYRANRPVVLKPVMVGSHGETLVRLLRPGIHSGTVPKLFAKLRKAARRALRRDRWGRFRKHRDALLHVEECIHHFIERELLHLLTESKSWGGLSVQTGTIALSTNRIRVELHCPTLAAEAVWLTFTERSAVLEGRVAALGWLARLSPEQRRALAAALAGLYKLGAVDAATTEATEVAMEDVVIPWAQWVRTWEDDQAGKRLPEVFPHGERLLPG